MKILSIALIGRHDQPLFVQAYTTAKPTPDEELKWHFVAHTSLDLFEEQETNNVRQNDQYSGLLHIMDDYAVYGYHTTTRVKLVLSIALTEEVIKDNDIKTIFRAIHNAYIAYLSNPFNEAVSDQPDYIAPPIRSKKFAAKLQQIAMAQNNAET